MYLLVNNTKFLCVCEYLCIYISVNDTKCFLFVFFIFRKPFSLSCRVESSRHAPFFFYPSAEAKICDIKMRSGPRICTILAHKKEIHLLLYLYVKFHFFCVHALPSLFSCLLTYTSTHNSISYDQCWRIVAPVKTTLTIHIYMYNNFEIETYYFTFYIGAHCAHFIIIFSVQPSRLYTT